MKRIIITTLKILLTWVTMLSILFSLLAFESILEYSVLIGSIVFFSNVLLIIICRNLLTGDEFYTYSGAKWLNKFLDFKN